MGHRGKQYPSICMIIICLTIFLQGYEDFLRHQADRAINRAGVVVVRGGQEERARSEEIRVGDIVKVEGSRSYTSFISTQLFYFYTGVSYVS